MVENNPVLDVISHRIKSKSKPWNRTDEYKVGLVTQGGCMRGVRLGGMLIASQALGLKDAFDGFYGDSAGPSSTAYLMGDQTPEGTTIYYDYLPENFVNYRRPLKGQPVVDIPWMAYEVMGKRVRKRVPLKWQSIAESPVPFHFYVSAADKTGARIVDLAQFKTKQDVLDAIHWTCRMPIIAGWPIEVQPGVFYTDGGVLTGTAPIQQAVEDGCTHILAYLTRSKKQPKKTSAMDNVIAKLLDHRHSGLGKGYLQGFSRYDEAMSLIEASEKNPSQAPFIQAVRFGSDATHIGRVEMRREVLVKGALDGYDAVIKAFRPYNLSVDQDVQVLR